MSGITLTKDQKHESISLRVKPHSHKAAPSITGSPLSPEAGTILFGHYNMEYLLPKGDRLRLIANHNQKTVQLMLFTKDAELIKRLPGERHSSLVANIINILNRYLNRVNNYSKPLTPEQEKKQALTINTINKLNNLLGQERTLNADDHHGHAQHKLAVLDIIERCRDENRLIATTPVVSEGSLGQILYDAYKAIHHYHPNRVYAVSNQDQLDFSDKTATHHLMWDSELHIGYGDEELNDALRVICDHYQLNPAQALQDIPANRFKRLEVFFKQLWLDAKDWVDYLASPKKPQQKKSTQEKRSDGLNITYMDPYYKLEGHAQEGYSNLDEMVEAISNQSADVIKAEDISIVNSDKVIKINNNNKVQTIKYFEHESKFYPLPDGEDLHTLSQISKRHLYLPEKIELSLRAFASHIPVFFKNFYTNLRNYIVNEIHHEFFDHVHEGHKTNDIELQDLSNIGNDYKEQQKQTTIYQILKEKKLLADGQTLEDFVKEQINKSPYVVARANHPPSPPAFNNPLHRCFELWLHFSNYFVDASARHPILGTLAISAYFYSGGAVIAPKILEEILHKMHLGILARGIGPTKAMAHAMCHGMASESIGISVTYWQILISGGNLDEFFEATIASLQNDPAKIAILVGLALSLGYGLTKAFPALQEEMGSFPYPNYLALGGKSGVAIYDTIMNTGDDWLLGTCKWVIHNLITLGKIVLAPFVESYYYGAKGFTNGLSKSNKVAVTWAKQILVGGADLMLLVLHFPMVEVTTMLIQIPFRGITNFIAKTLATIGNLGALGKSLTSYGEEQANKNYLKGFRPSPLYGFSSPYADLGNNKLTAYLKYFFNVFIRFPMELVKNFAVLPVIDLTTLSIRTTLSVSNQITWPFIYLIGSALQKFGSVWDPSLGLIFSSSARALIMGSNWLEKQVGTVKYGVLSRMDILRGHMYHWAFTEEDKKTHVELTDSSYYTGDVMRWQKVPHKHEDSNCLLTKLLGVPKTRGQNIVNNEVAMHKNPLNSTASNDMSHEYCNYSKNNV